MACQSPVDAWKSRDRNESGLRSLVYSPVKGYLDQHVKVPCGRCVFCRLELSRQWAVRAHHEASLYDQNCFITLTYRNEDLPPFRALDTVAPSDFMRRLRDKFGKGIRSFGCAEYGEKFGRPHYHLALFNFDFPDKEFFKRSLGNDLFRSKSLEELWPFGFSSVAGMSFESAAYIARYVTKKLSVSEYSSTAARERFINKHIGYSSLESRKLEVVRPVEQGVCIPQQVGLGKPWFEKYWQDVYPSDEVIIRGRKMRPPRYYDRLLKLANPDLYFKVKIQRMANARELPDVDTIRAIAKYNFKLLQFKKLIRGLEDEEEMYCFS